MAMGMRCLEVTLGPTASLKENKASNKVDPYAVLRLGDVECRTDSEAAPGSRPVWNHRFNFLLPRDAKADPRELHVDVWDSSFGADAFLGSCKVAMSRVYQKMSADVTQPVHRPCGKLVGHLRFHFAVLVEDATRGPETPPLPPPPTPLGGGWLTAAAASPTASARPSRSASLYASPLSLPPSGSVSASTPKSTPQSPASPAKDASEEEEGEPVSVSALLQSLKPSVGKGSKGAKRPRSSLAAEGDTEGEQRDGEEVEEVQPVASLKGTKRGAEGHKICKPKPQRPVSPSHSPAPSDSPAASPRAAPLALPPKKSLWQSQAPPPLDLSTAFAPTHKAITAVERLMGLSPTTSAPQNKPLAALISDGPIQSPASSGPGSLVAPGAGAFSDFFRPLPPLSDLATPAGEGAPSAAPSSVDQFERDCNSNSLGSQACQEASGLSGGAFQKLLKSNSTTSPFRGLGSEGAMSRSPSEKQWDVAALARLTSLFLNSQDQDAAASAAADQRSQAAPGTTPGAPGAEGGPSKGASEDWVLRDQAALAGALSAALLGTKQAQGGDKGKEASSPVLSKKPLASRSSAFKSTDSPLKAPQPQGGDRNTLAERMLFSLLTNASSESRKRQRVEA